jgi:ketosteroid isomerase-like protein
MSIESNKALVRKACQCLSDRNLSTLSDLIHPEGSWSVPYRPDMFEYGGPKDKKAEIALLTQFLGGFSSFSLEITGITAEGDRVAVEARSHGEGPGSATYQNVYSITFIIKDGKLHTVREFADPFQLAAYVAQFPK